MGRTKGAASLKLGEHELDLDKECMDQESHVKQVLIYEESGVTQRSVPPLAHVIKVVQVENAWSKS